MPYYFFQWTAAIVEHLAEHDLTPEDFKTVVCNPIKVRQSRTSGLPAATGYTDDGRKVIAIYEYLDEMTIIPVTAYEIE